MPIDPRKPAVRLPLVDGVVWAFAVLPDSRRVASVDWSGVLRVHDLKTGKQLDAHSRLPEFSGVRMIGEHTAASWSPMGAVVTWDVRTGQMLTQIRLKPPETFPHFRDVRFSAAGRHVAAWDGWSRCVLAEMATGKIVRETATESYEPLTAFFHPSGKEVALRDAGAKAFRYADLKTGKWTQSLPPFDEPEVHPSPDGRTLLTASNTSVALREAASGRPRWHVTMLQHATCRGRPLGQLYLAALVDKGRRIVVVRDIDATVYDPLTGRVLSSMAGHVRPGCAAVSACGRWLAVSRAPKRLSLFDLDAKEPTRPTFDGELSAPDFRAVALDADGSRVITAHNDGTCLVWDRRLLSKEADPWELLARLDPAEAQPAIAAFSKAPALALKRFAEKLTPAVEVPRAKIATWVKDLDAEDYERRSAAESALSAARDQAEPALREAIDKPLSLEQRRRAERLLKRLAPATDAEQLRQTRAVEILEALASREAVALLERLAKGAPSARLTREAKASLQRLTERDKS